MRIDIATLLTSYAGINRIRFNGPEPPQLDLSPCQGHPCGHSIRITRNRTPGSITLRDARTRTARTAELRGFSIVPCPVIWELHLRVLGAQGPGDESPDGPVHSVSWQEAVSWCNALSITSGPTPRGRVQVQAPLSDGMK